MGKNNSFIEEINPILQKRWNESGYEQPTSIQSETIPLILQKKDIIAQSPTGTGKTLAYLLPLIDDINADSNSLQKLILAPSRELVMQIHQEIQKWSKGLDLISAAFVGGANIKRQVERLKDRPQIIVGTPGRVLELINLRKLKMHEVNTIVLDEGDQLLEKEHLQTVQTIVKSTLNDRQLLLFSATSVKDIDQVIAMIGRAPDEVKVERNSKDEPSNVQHLYLLSEQRDRAKLLQKIAGMKDVKALVFVRSVGNMEILAKKLAYENISSAMLHSDLGKVQREKSLNALRDGEIKLLLTTDVATRGLDIEGLTHVIHYDFPADREQYIHRSGRTGRMGAAGTVVSFVTPREERELRKIARELRIEIMLRRIYKGNFVEVKPRGNSKKFK